MRYFPRYTGPALLEQVCEVENLTRAWRRVRSNIQVARRAHSAGVDHITIRDFEADWANQMDQLTAELRDGSYRPVQPRVVQIPKASGGMRALAILTVRDRIAQRAVLQILEPLFEPYFLDCSYGCRPLVGVPEAVARVERYAAQGWTWALDADIAGYFDAIDQSILMGLLRQRIDETPLLHLIAQWLAVGTVAQGDAAAAAGGQDAPTPLRRGGEVIHALIDYSRDLVEQGATHVASPQAAGGWSSVRAAADFGWDDPLAPPSPYLAGQWMRALPLAQSALRGAARALPAVKQLDRRQARMIGAVAAGALGSLIVGEVVARQRSPGGRGTMQGGALSPLLSNIYLHPFDVALVAHGFHPVRFVDDFVVMCGSEEEAWRAYAFAARQLSRLHLRLHLDKTRVADCTAGLEFLGRTLAPPRRSPRLENGLITFAEAERALQASATAVRTGVTRQQRGNAEDRRSVRPARITAEEGEG